jgi:hypothetical protein
VKNKFRKRLQHIRINPIVLEKSIISVNVSLLALGFSYSLMALDCAKDLTLSGFPDLLLNIPASTAFVMSILSLSCLL